MSGVRVEVTRGGQVESVHELDVAVVEGDGRVVAWAGQVERRVFVRSAIKPLQALPLVEDGVAERLGITDEELAICCASHSGEPRHLAVVRSLLERAGVGEDALACGPHMPFDEAAARALRAAGRGAEAVHNNCSGKHAGMLALAGGHGWGPREYHRPDHPVQQRMLEELARWTGEEQDRIGTGIDGCGVVTFAVPLEALARAFARLGSAAAGGDAGPARVVGAMAAHPYLVGGRNRLCTRVAEVTGGRVVAKVGAEGVYAVTAPERGLGIALKVRDGAKRAAEVGLLAVLDALSLLSDDDRASLRPWARPEVTNTRAERVGELRPVVVLEAVA